MDATDNTLVLGGTVTNGSSGLLSAQINSKVLVSQGLTANDGNINLLGGTFDNNGNAMTNNGQISGYGILRTGGLTNNDLIGIQQRFERTWQYIQCWQRQDNSLWWRYNNFP